MAPEIVLADNIFNYTALTISAWIYPSGSGNRVIIETYNWVASPGSQGWILKIDNATNKLLMVAHNGDCGTYYPTDPTEKSRFSPQHRYTKNLSMANTNENPPTRLWWEIDSHFATFRNDAK